MDVIEQIAHRRLSAVPTVSKRAKRVAGPA